MTTTVVGKAFCPACGRQVRTRVRVEQKDMGELMPQDRTVVQTDPRTGQKVAVAPQGSGIGSGVRKHERWERCTECDLELSYSRRLQAVR